VQNRMVLDLGSDDVIAFGLICLSGCFQSPVVALGAAAGEINLIWFCADRIRNRLARMVNCLFCSIRKTVYRRTVAIILGNGNIASTTS
jgi:hypothetical protein